MPMQDGNGRDEIEDLSQAGETVGQDVFLRIEECFLVKAAGLQEIRRSDKQKTSGQFIVRTFRRLFGIIQVEKPALGRSLEERCA